MGLWLVRVGEGHAHGHVFHAGDRHNGPAAGLVHRRFLVAIKGKDLVDAGGPDAAIPPHHNHGSAQVKTAAAHLAGPQAAQIRRIVDGGDLKLQGALRIARRRRHVPHDHFADGVHVCALGRVAEAVERIAALGRGIDHREVQNFVRCAQSDQQIEHLIHRPVGPGRRLVDLVHHQKNREPGSQRLFHHKKGLGHGALLGVDQEYRAVGHAQHPLHLTAEIGVAGRIDDVDLIPAVTVGAVFGGNGDTALAFQFHGIHQAFRHLLVVAKHAALAEELVN